jgi:exonuclease SbcC
MRPLKLEIEGFTSFNDPTYLDMTDLDLFAITGPTGAGKSSLIDAMCYALYGEIPRVGTEVGSCIRYNHDRMRVTLEFAAGEDHFRIFRETRRKGAPNIRLDHWENSDWQPVADRAKDVKRIIEATVGLDYDGFTRSVLLPQGQFQELLAGSPEKRRGVLRSLLRLDVYERVRARASETASYLSGRVKASEQALLTLAGATPENAARLETELDQHHATATRLATEAQALSAALDLSFAVDKTREAECAATSEAQAALTELNNARETAEAGDQKRAVLLAEVEALTAKLKANCYEPTLQMALTNARGRAENLHSVTQDLATAEDGAFKVATLLLQADANVTRTAKAHEGAVKALEAAAAALREAERHDLAAAVRSGLKAGDPCPVCGGKVGVLERDESPHFEQAQATHKKAFAAEAEARNVSQLAVVAHTQSHTRGEGMQARIAELTQRRTELTAALEAALPGETDRSLVAITTALKQQERARAERVQLEAAAKDATGQLERLEGQLEKAKEQEEALLLRADAAATALTEAQAAVECAVALLRDALACWPGIEVTPDTTLLLKRRLGEAQTGQNDARVAAAQVEERLKRLRDDVERADKLRQELETLKRDYGYAYELAHMLQTNRFQTWLQGEALQTLANDGSRRLEELSGGRYRLSASEDLRDFVVIDQWNGGLEKRSVKTLSGGETFLASLALALALAESLPALAASGRVVLDSIFLDEGFGSLDPEALNLAADALDALRSENRMVCVITHLQELAERLPARVTVTKTEAGSTVAVA